MKMNPDLLLTAARSNQVQCVQNLLTCSADEEEEERRGFVVDPNHANAAGQTALHIACLSGHVEVVQALLKAGANSNTKNRILGSTPLHMVVTSPIITRMATISTAAGATAMIRTDTTTTVVGKNSSSFSEKAIHVIDWLLRFGADPDLTDDRGNRPIDYLMMDDSLLSNNYDNLERQALIDKLTMAKEQKLAISLEAAVEAVDKERVCQLLLSDEKIVVSPAAGTAFTRLVVDKLLVAIKDQQDTTKVQDCLSILKLLVTHKGTTSNTTNNCSTGSVLVGKASSGGTATSVVYEDSFESRDDDRHPLVKTLEALRKVYETLQKNPPDSSNQQQQQQQEHLNNNRETIQQLFASVLEETACLLVQDYHQHQRITTAPPNNSGLDLFVDVFHQAARRNELRMVRFCIERLHMNPNTAGRQGMSALQFAARSGQMGVLTYLLSLDSINVHTRDNRGQSALDAACVNDKQDAVRALGDHIHAKKGTPNKNESDGCSSEAPSYEN